MTRRVAAALAFTLLTCPALAQPVAAVFSPPLDRAIDYEVVETRRHAGNALSFTLNQRVRFARDGRGYRMTVTMLSASSDAPAAIARRFDATFRPFVELEIALLLSADGKPLGLIDEAGTWARLMASVEALRADKALAPDDAATIEAVFASIAALPVEARQAKLMENPLRLIGYALPPMAPGDRQQRNDAGDAASATLKNVAIDTLTYAVQTRRALSQDMMLVSDGELVVDRATGLLRHSVTRDRIGRGAAPGTGEPDAIITVAQRP